MNKKILTGVTSCTLAAMMLCTGAAAQAVSQDGMAVISTENTSFSDCVEKIRSVYTERYPGQVEVVSGVIDDVTSDETFLACYEYEGKTAFRILEDTLMDALTPTIEPYNYNGTVAWTSYTVPQIAQVENNYCGPASVQMALIGNGLSENNTNNRSESKQRSIASTMGIGGGVADIISDITPYMNIYYSSNAIAKYRVKGFTVNTCNKLPYYLSDSLRSNAVPIMLIPNTAYLEYYKGYSCSHFVIVTRVDSLNKTITIVDPFHVDGMNAVNERCFGEHTITYDQLYNVISNNPNITNRDIWASVYSYDTSGVFEYIY